MRRANVVNEEACQSLLLKMLSTACDGLLTPLNKMLPHLSNRGAFASCSDTPLETMVEQ
jgi:hypothetical protein